MQVQSKNSNIIIFLVLSVCFIIHVEGIYQPCSFNSDCPANAFCGYRKYCVCNDNYIMNCNITAVNLGVNPVTVTISQTQTYYTIVPQELFQFIKFSILFTTSNVQPKPVIVSIWGQSGYLKDFGNNKMQEVSFDISSTESQSIDTTFFQFGLQPNGQSQVLYLGIMLNTTVPSDTLSLSISVEQQVVTTSNVFQLVLTILMAVLSVACFVLIGFCIYRRKKMQAMRQRAQQQKQLKSTQHFDQYMPKVLAQRVKVPLQVCSVCLNDITLDNYVRLTICKHLFHSECLDSWCKKNISCPICRQELDFQSCQAILGEGFDLSESQSIQKVTEKYQKEIQMTERNANINNMSHLNQQQILDDNTMRRNML